MTKYQEIRNELKRRQNSTTHFTKEFYTDFTAAQKERAACIENGTDDSYKAGNVLLFHSYDRIYSSKFYQLNSASYCEFLSIYHAMTA